MNRREWRVEFMRGALRYAVLRALAAEKVHGYELLVRLQEKGLGHTKGGVIYPLLRRLEEDGLVSHAWDTDSSGPARKVFELTEQGRQSLSDAEIAWNDITESLSWLKTMEPR